MWTIGRRSVSDFIQRQIANHRYRAYLRSLTKRQTSRRKILEERARLGLLRRHEAKELEACRDA